MTDIIQGNDCLFQINTTGEFKTLVCSKSFLLSVETETKETTTRGDGGWRDYDYKTLGYTITLSGLLKLTDSEGRNTYNDLFQQQINFLEVQYRIIYTDPSGNNAIVAGTVIITRTALNTSAGSQVESDIEMIGKGSFGSFEISETTTVDFKIQSTNFDATNLLTAGNNAYKVSDFKILLTTSDSSDQQVGVSYSVPKLGASFASDYSVNTVGTGISNPSTISATDGGTVWNVIAVFDFTPSTSNKVYQLLIN